METTNIPPLILIRQLAEHLELPATATALAMIYHHVFRERFVKGPDLKLQSENIVAITCVHLCVKIQEVPRKLRDILNVSHNLLCPGEEPLKIGKDYWELRDKVSQCELLLLRVLSFQPKIETPHQMMYNILHYTLGEANLQTLAGATVSQVAATLLFDSFHSSLAIKYRSNELAAAMVYTALKITRTEGTKREWMKDFGFEASRIEGIADSLLGRLREKELERS